MPENVLNIGDEFEFKRKMAIGSAGTLMQGENVSIQVFTLEEVSKGLAYFSVKERTLGKFAGTGGAGTTETAIAGKGDAIFDLEQGMWLKLTEKSRAKLTWKDFPGLGDQNPSMDTILKYEMEQK